MISCRAGQEALKCIFAQYRFKDLSCLGFKTMFCSLCQPDIYVHLYYVVNVEAETKIICLCQPVLYVNLYYRANIEKRPCFNLYVNLIFMSTCIT